LFPFNSQTKYHLFYLIQCRWRAGRGHVGVWPTGQINKSDVDLSHNTLQFANNP